MGRIPDRFDWGWEAVPVFGFGIDAAGFHYWPSQDLIVRRRGEIMCIRLERK
jgi:hypothetical protein